MVYLKTPNNYQTENIDQRSQKKGTIKLDMTSSTENTVLIQYKLILASTNKDTDPN